MLWTEGEGSRQLANATNVEQVRISDDGQVIAYTSRYSHGGYEIFAVNADGTHQQVLVGWDYLQDFQPINSEVFFDFVPGSHALYFVTDQNDLHRVSTDGGAPSLVFGAGQGGRFTFSPDGQWMTLYHPREMVLAHSNGSAAHVVYQWDPDSCADPQLTWSPDSAGFRMLIPISPQSSPNSMEVWYFPIKGDPAKQMSYAGHCGAHLSPDGRTAVYLNERHEPIDVHVVAQNGQDTTYNSYSSKSYFNLQFMGWAPDSKHFLLNLSPGRLEVPYLCAVGEQPVKLTDTDDANAIVWVDAQRVLFDRRGLSLHLQRVGTPSILLDANASSWFDYTYVNP
jgi:Tol biopolymer transport system component